MMMFQMMPPHFRNYGPVFETTYVSLYICSCAMQVLCFVMDRKLSSFSLPRAFPFAFSL